MALAQKIIPHYTYEDYLHWEGRWELIEGHPIAMSPSSIPQHQRVFVELTTLFNNTVKKKDCGKCKVYGPIDYKIAEDTIIAPDILIIYQEVKKKYLDFAPSLVVEILSPSSSIRDRNTKYEIYEQQGVKYYLLVDVEKKAIEIFALTNGKYSLQSLFQGNFEFALDEECKMNVDFTNLAWD